jgi:hypothetical protein
LVIPSGTVTVEPFSLTSTGAAGALPSLTQSEQWKIAAFTSASINGNSSPTPANIAAAFHLDSTTLAAFASANSVPSSDFSISADAGDVYVNFSPTPEPTSFGMLLLGAGGLVLRRRRRRTNAPMHDPLIS